MWEFRVGNILDFQEAAITTGVEVLVRFARISRGDKPEDVTPEHRGLVIIGKQDIDRFSNAPAETRNAILGQVDQGATLEAVLPSLEGLE
ncbi:MAG: hypothetical protein J4432_03230 [DPANN group archaeon]|nr:hypothetical protein [DPANN group archaeon]